jgi:hypothetical protein
MPAGTPITMKCPKCMRGKYGYPRQDRGCRATGNVGPHVVRSNHRGSGKGGSAFTGYPGLAECFDCGHTWLSTHPASGRKRLAC